MSDEETIAVYDAQVDAYDKLTVAEGPDNQLKAFMNQLPVGGYVLDLGCGPANSAAIIHDKGFRVDPVDASPEMVRLANEKHNINARIGVFEDINEEAIYDGVWANFSLLHAKVEEFPHHLKAIHRALKSEGIFHIGMKVGTDEIRDRLGRFYAYYSEDELRDHLTNAGFTILEETTGEEAGLAGDVSPWICILSKKND